MQMKADSNKKTWEEGGVRYYNLNLPNYPNNVAILDDGLSLSVGGLSDQGRIRSWCIVGREGNVYVRFTLR